MNINIKELSFYVATMGGLGFKFGGSLLATLYAIPVLVALQLLYWLSPLLWMIAMVTLLLLSSIAVHYALQHDTDYDASVIVIDKWLGFMLVFSGITLRMNFSTVKLLVVGFILFHLLRFFLPIISYRFWGINFYQLPMRMFTALISGGLLNIFFRFMLWIAS